MAILWQEEYSIGLETIDQQHKKFIEILNKLSESFAKDHTQREIIWILKELEQYALTHFKFEEKYFHEFHYKYTHEHERHHKSFYDKIQSLKQQLEAGDSMLDFDVFTFMEEWLRTHILKEDLKYVPCFKKNGLK